MVGGLGMEAKPALKQQYRKRTLRTPGRLKTKKGRVTFRQFIDEQRHIIGTKYPFLTIYQVEGKAKALWRQLKKQKKKTNEKVTAWSQTKGTGVKGQSSQIKSPVQDFDRARPSTTLSLDSSVEDGSQLSSPFSPHLQSAHLGWKTYAGGVRWSHQSYTPPQVIETIPPPNIEGILASSKENGRKEKANVSFNDRDQQAQVDSLACTEREWVHGFTPRCVSADSETQPEKVGDSSYDLSDSDSDREHQLLQLHSPAFIAKKFARQFQSKRRKEESLTTQKPIQRESSASWQTAPMKSPLTKKSAPTGSQSAGKSSEKKSSSVQKPCQREYIDDEDTAMADLTDSDDDRETQLLSIHGNVIAEDDPTIVNDEELKTEPKNPTGTFSSIKEKPSKSNAGQKTLPDMFKQMSSFTKAKVDMDSAQPVVNNSDAVSASHNKTHIGPQDTQTQGQARPEVSTISDSRLVTPSSTPSVSSSLPNRIVHTDPESSLTTPAMPASLIADTLQKAGKAPTKKRPSSDQDTCSSTKRTRSSSVPSVEAGTLTRGRKARRSLDISIGGSRIESRKNRPRSKSMTSVDTLFSPLRLTRQTAHLFDTQSGTTPRLTRSSARTSSGSKAEVCRGSQGVTKSQSPFTNLNRSRQKKTSGKATVDCNTTGSVTPEVRQSQRLRATPEHPSQCESDPRTSEPQGTQRKKENITGSITGHNDGGPDIEELSKYEDSERVVPPEVKPSRSMTPTDPADVANHQIMSKGSDTDLDMFFGDTIGGNIQDDDSPVNEDDSILRTPCRVKRSALETLRRANSVTPARRANVRIAPLTPVGWCSSSSQSLLAATQGRVRTASSPTFKTPKSRPARKATKEINGEASSKSSNLQMDDLIKVKPGLCENIPVKSPLDHHQKALPLNLSEQKMGKVEVCEVNGDQDTAGTDKGDMHVGNRPLLSHISHTKPEMKSKFDQEGQSGETSTLKSVHLTKNKERKIMTSLCNSDREEESIGKEASEEQETRTSQQLITSFMRRNSGLTHGACDIIAVGDLTSLQPKRVVNEDAQTTLDVSGHGQTNSSEAQEVCPQGVSKSDDGKNSYSPKTSPHSDEDIEEGYYTGELTPPTLPLARIPYASQRFLFERDANAEEDDDDIEEPLSSVQSSWAVEDALASLRKVVSPEIVFREVTLSDHEDEERAECGLHELLSPGLSGLSELSELSSLQSPVFTSPEAGHRVDAQSTRPKPTGERQNVGSSQFEESNLQVPDLKDSGDVPIIQQLCQTPYVAVTQSQTHCGQGDGPQVVLTSDNPECNLSANIKPSTSQVRSIPQNGEKVIDSGEDIDHQDKDTDHSPAYKLAVSYLQQQRAQTLCDLFQDPSLPDETPRSAKARLVSSNKRCTASNFMDLFSTTDPDGFF